MISAPAQHMAALARANEVRRATATYLAKIHSGQITLAEAMLDCELPIRLDRLVFAKLRVPRKRLRALCAQAGLHQDIAFYRVAGPRTYGYRPLTNRERCALHAIFEEAGL